MPLWIDVLRWSGLVMAALPLVICVVLWAAKRDPVPDAWLIAAAFAISAFMDLMMRQLLDSGAQSTAWVGYIGYPLQFGLLTAIVAQRPETRLMGLGLIMLLAMAGGVTARMLVVAGHSMVVPPESGVRLIGGVMVGVLVYLAPNLERFRAPVMLYALGCLPAILAMVVAGQNHLVQLVAWGDYKVVQLLALCWMTWVVLRSHLQEVTHGPRHDQTTRSRVLDAMGRGFARLGGGHRAVVASPKR